MGASAQMPGRLLRLLSLLQSRREWPGPELAERLGVTDRTLRRDVGRLRALDYPVRGTTGTAGGYRLEPGAHLPPLVLDDDEALAVAVGLVTAAGVAGIDASAMSALAKLERGLPPRVRPRFAALAGGTAVDTGTAPVDPTVLAVLSVCCRERELVGFVHRDRFRRVEAHHVVAFAGHWYLLAFDPDRADWRTFRVDRVTDPRPTHRSYPSRELPDPDPAAFLTRRFAEADYRHTAWVDLDLSVDEVRAGVAHLLPRGVEIRPADRGARVRLSADSPVLVAQYVAVVAALGAATVEAPDEVRRLLDALARALSPRASAATSSAEG